MEPPQLAVTLSATLYFLKKHRECMAFTQKNPEWKKMSFCVKKGHFVRKKVILSEKEERRCFDPKLTKFKQLRKLSLEIPKYHQKG